jgi:hypothetical protein
VYSPAGSENKTPTHILFWVVVGSLIAIQSSLVLWRIFEEDHLPFYDDLIQLLFNGSTCIGLIVLMWRHKNIPGVWRDAEMTPFWILFISLFAKALINFCRFTIAIYCEAAQVDKNTVKLIELCSLCCTAVFFDLFPVFAQMWIVALEISVENSETTHSEAPLYVGPGSEFTDLQ